jgi:hypothetical protein
LRLGYYNNMKKKVYINFKNFFISGNSLDRFEIPNQRHNPNTVVNCNGHKANAPRTQTIIPKNINLQ